MCKRGESHPTEKADLFGKRLVVGIETEEGRRLAESLVKDLTGGDRLRARRMREDFWEFAPTHKVVLCTNHKPTITGDDHAIWRRIRLIPFTVPFWNPDVPGAAYSGRPEELRQDKGLREKLDAELPGILAWCLRGCLEWQANKQTNGLQTPVEVMAATREYRDEQDVIGQFIAECCQVGSKDYRGKASDLYAAFQIWAADNDGTRWTQRKFGIRLGERGFQRYTNDGVRYEGVALNHDWAAKV
jgi:putative DNA primase/helicase